MEVELENEGEISECIDITLLQRQNVVIGISVYPNLGYAERVIGQKGSLFSSADINAEVLTESQFKITDEKVEKLKALAKSQSASEQGGSE